MCTIDPVGDAVAKAVEIIAGAFIFLPALIFGLIE